MTTVVIDCENQEVFADTCKTLDYHHSPEPSIKATVCMSYCDDALQMARQRKDTTKVHKVGDVVIVGVGDGRFIEKFIDHYPNFNGMRLQGLVDATVFVVEKRGKGVVIDQYDVVAHKRNWRIKDSFEFDVQSFVKTKGQITAGSGGDLAMGALLAGKNAQEAIKLASQMDPYTSSTVQSVKL